ncbi:MAG TPA: DUF4097 family beta strand repeat-containing protein [Rhodothermales bacterium]|nr:DUF4097 family beta strand repeat-containing protein [Rhodothermales bacterium]
MKKSISIIVLAGLLLVGCGSEPETPEPVEVTESETRTLTLPGAALSVAAFNGALTVEGTRDSVVTVTFDKKATALSQAAADSALAQIEITEGQRDTTRTLRLKSDPDLDTAVDMTVKVPYKTALTLETENGMIEVAGVTAPISATVNNGSVEIKGAANDVVVQGGNGDITVDMAGFRAETNVDLRNNNGDINLTVPPSVSAIVEAQTTVGGITIEGVSLEERTEEKSTTGSLVKGRTGQGTGTINLRTEHGAITLEQGQ